MKRCPECRRDYFDDSLMYCLDDGSELLEGPASLDEPATAILHETTPPVEAATRAQIHTTDQTAILPTSAGDVLSKPRGLDKRILAALLLLAIIALGAFFAYRYIKPANGGRINSIAVLPFQNVSRNADSEYLSDGLAESLIYRLSQLPNLKVSPVSSVIRYKGKEVDAQKIAAELGVNAVMSGRMTQRGDSLTISVELIDTVNNKILWGEQYERKMTDLLSTQREIALVIAEKLQLKLAGDEKGLTKNYTTSSEAYQLYLKGRYYWNKRDGESLKKAIEQFKAAADKDPNFALAYVGLSDCYALSTEYLGTPTSESLPQATAHAKRAIEIDDSLAEAHTSLALVNEMSFNWGAVEPEYKKAIELNPNYATAHHWYGLFLRYHGRPEEGLVEMKRAHELDPLSIIISDNLVEGYLIVGDINSAYELAKQVIELDPSNWGPHHRLALVYLAQGNKQEALSEWQKAVELAKRSSFSLSYYGYGLALLGKREEAAGVIKELEEKFAKGQAAGRDIAHIYVGIGDKDQAFAWLEKDFQVHNSNLTELKSDFGTESLHSDPRFKDLLNRMNLPE